MSTSQFERCPHCGQPTNRKTGPRPARLWHKQKLILEALIRRPQMGRDQLIDIVWKDDPNGGPDDAATCLQTLISKMRRILAPYGVRVSSSSEGPGGCAVYFIPEADRACARDYLAALNKPVREAAE